MPYYVNTEPTTISLKKGVADLGCQHYPLDPDPQNPNGPGLPHVAAKDVRMVRVDIFADDDTPLQRGYGFMVEADDDAEEQAETAKRCTALVADLTAQGAKNAAKNAVQPTKIQF